MLVKPPADNDPRTFAIIGAADRRSGFLAYGIVQFGFAVINAALGFVLLTGAPRPN